MNIFTVIREDFNKEDKTYNFGIKCVYPDEEVVISDITNIKENADYIAETFNAEQPEKVHIFDIIENYLLDFNGF